MNKYFIFPSVFIIGKDIFNSRIKCNLLAIKNKEKEKAIKNGLKVLD